VIPIFGSALATETNGIYGVRMHQKQTNWYCQSSNGDFYYAKKKASAFNSVG
jgi:hypothetical protein